MGAKSSVPNNGNGRRSLIMNVNKWTKFRGQTRRIALLQSDWAYIGNDQLKEFVGEYAEDNEKFLDTFGVAFRKVSELGMHPDHKRVCSPRGCSFDPSSGFSCPYWDQRSLKLEKLEFPLEGECNPDSETVQSFEGDQPCVLEGAFGVFAKINCPASGWHALCATKRALKHMDRVVAEWEEGGTEPICRDATDVPKAPSFLAHTTTHQKRKFVNTVVEPVKEPEKKSLGRGPLHRIGRCLRGMLQVPPASLACGSSTHWYRRLNNLSRQHAKWALKEASWLL
jgi:hypothetical protein